MNAEASNSLKLTPERYVRERIEFKLAAYSGKAKMYRLRYLIMSVVSVVGAASVPALINMGVNTLVPTVVSLIVTIMVSLEGLFHYREQWKNYDLITSFLKYEQMCFEAKTGVYRKKDDSEAFALLVKRVEDGILKERSETVQLRTSVEKDE